MNAKRFREDLFYRIAQVVVEVPSLRERTEDIPDLVARFLDYAGDPGAIDRIDKPTMDRLMRHGWPGNVRQLRNVVLAAHAQTGGGPIDFSDVLSTRTSSVAQPDRASSLKAYQVLKREMLDALERDYFSKLHGETGGNLSEMSRRSGLSRSTVREHLQRHDLREAPE
jgi:DNA-binding NtrC family response regulator